MQVIQLYIEDNPIELFKDESVSITDSIKSVRDIAKVFTAFSKTFTIPASRNNNKIFKHYYNFDIDNGYDARTKKSAKIELNYLPYKKGKIKLEGVQLKNNKPYSYKVTFFGETVDLKDLLGDDKLNQLTSLNSLSLDYDSPTIKSKLQSDPTTNDIIAPLITHTERLYYRSSANTSSDGNLWYHTGSGQVHEHGVLFNELKYALRVHKIIEAIETQYDITFSDDFFTSTNAPYYNLFMWLHRKKGLVESDTGGAFSNLINGWSFSVGTVSAMINTSTLRIYDSTVVTGASLTLSRSGTVPYDIVIKKNGITVITDTGVTSTSATFSIPAIVITSNSEYTVTLTYNSTLDFTNIQWNVVYIQNGQGALDQYNTNTYQAPATFEFVITSQVPEIKVIDFLTGIFKMFNLTAYVENGVIIVKTLDDFYNSYNTYDISEYVDVESSEVNLALPYKEIIFKYEDTDTFLAAIHEQLFNYEWAAEDYKQTDASGNKLDGGDYKIELPFGHLKFERLFDDNLSTNTNIQVGYNVDDNQESYIGKPVLFYPIRLTGATTPSSNTISFRDTETSHSAISAYNIPSNSVALDPTSTSYNINFKNEFNEWTGNTDFTNTLFEAFYSNYITSIFNEKNRLTKVKAYLPLRILRNLVLSDRLIINNKQYKINSIKTNLLNGKSDIELLNDL